MNKPPSVVTDIADHRPMTALYTMTVYTDSTGKLCACIDWAADEWLADNVGTMEQRLVVIADDTPAIAESLLIQSRR